MHLLNRFGGAGKGKPNGGMDWKDDAIGGEIIREKIYGKFASAAPDEHFPVFFLFCT